MSLNNKDAGLFAAKNDWCFLKRPNIIVTPHTDSNRLMIFCMYGFKDGSSMNMFTVKYIETAANTRYDSSRSLSTLPKFFFCPGPQYKKDEVHKATHAEETHSV